MSNNTIEPKDLELTGYSGSAEQLVRKSGAKKGSKVKIRTKDGFEITGLLIPRYESGSAENIVLKLKSGYNVGIDASTIASLESIEEPLLESPSDGTAVRRIGPTTEKTVLLLSTGGTIASKVDYRTGAVKPAYTAADLYSSVPELGNVAIIQPEVIFSELSENLAQEHWQKLSGIIVDKIRSKAKFDGIVLMLGTDTLAYVSAALSFSLIGLQFPVVCVGAQRSSDRPSADSALNLIGATSYAAEFNEGGVFVAMHENESDDTIAIHSGVRVRKNHTSRRDAFQSIDIPVVARVSNGKIDRNSQFPKTVLKGKVQEEFKLQTRFNPNVALVKFYPGLDASLFDYLSMERKTKGFIIEGTGLGHVSSKIVEKISGLAKQEIFFGITSQCIRGHVDLHVYETGIDLIKAGAVSLGNMLSETALVKLSWALGNFEWDQIKDIMSRNLVGEMTERILLR